VPDSLFQPSVIGVEEEEALGAENATIVHRPISRS